MRDYRILGREEKRYGIQTDLDTFGEEVSGLGGVFGDLEGSSDLGVDINSRVGGLAEKSEGTQHSQSAMLDFLNLLLVEFFGAVVKVERVDARSGSLSQLKITGHSVGALGADQRNTSEFDQGEDQDDLGNGLTGNVFEFFDGVGVRVGVDTGPLVTREGSENTGPDESDNGQLGDASVGDLGFSQPLDITHGVGGTGFGVKE